ncbi:TRAP-type C4-dicarboxylate transport system, substrate-binding protein [Tranquillimonas rosea]|uniref:TRAP-type C4-dicarboxylate transport system, substrate-binding protein n=1 Tax=Tranquillimonas rosea TaxID=641238 RepID=A0A1H9WAM2_9RHOB|nr:C4-dicarboxylate TRAP transporter substrate-binding protein [Tranquillimonas rosea]SES30992.1 TRAP-type C4-dicarboxylate transport system, substrate-binding protein [Tranquillimonas rosea]
MTKRFELLRATPVAAVLAAGLGAGGAATAQETVQASIVSGFSPSVAVVKIMQEVFMPRTNEILAENGNNYQVEWQEAFSGTLAKPGGELEAVETGLADVGAIVTAIHSDKLPLYSIGYVTPFTTTDLVLIHEVMDDLTEEYPAFRESWEPFNQVPLSVSGIGDNYILCSREPIESTDDIDGLKVTGIGPNLRWVQPMGAAGVNGSLGDFYQLVETGVADAMLVWGEAVVSLKYYEVCSNYYDARLGGANAYVISVNQQAWDSYPEEVQQAMTTAAQEFGVAIGEFSHEMGAKAREIVKENGGQVTEITDEEREAWAETLPDIAGEWAGRLEEQGIPAEAILDDYMQAMRDAGAPAVRDWDE